MPLTPIETNFDGRRFRSRTEARWAVFFKHLGWEYDYEREGYDLQGDWYLPDFFLPAFPMFIEVKGDEPTDRETELCRRLCVSSGHRVLIVVGAPMPHAEQFIMFEPGEAKPKDVRFLLLSDRRNAGEFWLAASDGENLIEYFSIGPVSGKPHDRAPLMQPELSAAFTAARSARFEHGEQGRN